MAKANPIVIGNSRFTFITPNLVRLEYAENAQFLDERTLFAQNRNSFFPDVKLEKKEGEHYTMTTPAMRVEFDQNGFPFGQKNLHVYFSSGGEQKHWYIASEQTKNLKGAVSTLDGISGPISLEDGLLSRDGWFLIRDTNREILKNGWIFPRAKEHIQDLYLFVYGDDYKSALKSLSAISGNVPMTRKYVHGSWYCRWWNYTADDYRKIVEEYKAHDFPLDIMVFDMGWHKQKEAKVGTGHAGTFGWTGYSWNRELIPDPAKLISELKQDGIQVVLNEHPHDGIRPHEDMYSSFIHELKQNGMNVSEEKCPIFDAGNKIYMDAFMKYAHEESEKMGIAFWWLDWQQDSIYPVVRGTNLKHLQWLNELYFYHSQKDNLRGAGFSRWAGWGDHRHPIQFSGDAVSTWNLLRFEVELTATSGNAGCFFWAHDLGGFSGERNPEMMVRWIQFGLLNSSMRVHSVIDPGLDRRPWLWGKEEEKVMRTMYHLRSQLMPYIYSSVRQCHTETLPLNRAMYIEYPKDENAYKNPQEFLFGDLLLGAPITSSGKGVHKVAEQTVWLPPGEKWYHLFTGKCNEGGQMITEQSDISTFPLYAKGGYPIPMQPYTQRMASTPLDTMIVRSYPGNDGVKNSYTLYEDDGISCDYLKGQYATTKMDYFRKNRVTEITIHPAQGTYQGQVQKRAYRFELPCIRISEKLTATVNGENVSIKPSPSLHGIEVELPAMDIKKKISLRLSENR